MGPRGLLIDSQPAVVSVRHLSKQFGGARALDDVNLSVSRGQVHGLLGHNGSGKSTLIKILSGYHAPESGSELYVNGDPIPLPLAPGQYRSLGFGFVHQDLGLIPSLSVVENLRIAELTSLGPGPISWRAERKAARKTMERYGISLDPRAEVRTLRPWDRAALAIARAMNEMQRRDGADVAPGLLVLDEPTAFLPKERKELLYRIIHEIAATGAAVLFVSHDIDEVMEITDSVTVLRDGRVAGTSETRHTTASQLIELIVGHGLQPADFEEHEAAVGGIRGSVKGLTGGALADVSFSIHRGEIIGLTGILGAGFEQLPYLLFGVNEAVGGVLELDGATHSIPSVTPVAAIAAGIRLVPEDRRSDGTVGALPLWDNLTLPVLGDFFATGRLQRRELTDYTRVLLDRFQVRPADPQMRLQDLSGGNQQKALLAKWLQGSPTLLLLHEPTQGVDVGARQQIFQLILEAARSGVSVIVASSDHEQLATLCDRVLIFRSGKIVHEIPAGALTKHRITAECYEVRGQTEVG